jgi:hypothetical protein
MPRALGTAAHCAATPTLGASSAPTRSASVSGWGCLGGSLVAALPVVAVSDSAALGVGGPAGVA